jgi:hypothetical protein
LCALELKEFQAIGQEAARGNPTNTGTSELPGLIQARS